MVESPMINYIPSFIRKRLFVAYGLLTRPMTLGVRAIILNDKKQVLLVRHTYVEGWFFPGGGVERGETLVEAIIKEVLEETAITLTQRPKFHHLYRNTRTSRFDHVALFLCENWKQGNEWVPDHEICEIGFFALDDLPPETNLATIDRLDEVFGKNPTSDYW